MRFFLWTGVLLAVLNWTLAVVNLPQAVGFMNLIAAAYITYILVTWNEDNYYTS